MKRGILISTVVIITIISIFTIYIIGFKNPAVLSPIDIVNEKQAVSEVLIGSILSIQTEQTTECFEEKIFRFEIIKVEKSENSLQKGEKINIKYNQLIKPTTTECIDNEFYPILFTGDYLKVYANKNDDETYYLPIKGSSTECNGCPTSLGRCPKTGARFNITETLEIFQIPPANIIRGKRAKDSGGSYCSNSNKMMYYKKLNEVCSYDFECETDLCQTGICFTKTETPKDQEQTQEPETVIDITQETPPTEPEPNFFQKIIDWFKNIFS